jgi:hypothetical protein
MKNDSFAIVRRLGQTAALLVLLLGLTGCSRPAPCERLFERQLQCGWSRPDPDKGRFVKECAKSFTPLHECGERPDCDAYKSCLATALQKHSAIAAAWRSLLLACGLDTEGGEAPRR